MSGPTLVPPACLLLRVQDCYLLRLNFPDLFRSHNLNRVVVVRNPELQAVRFGLFPFRSPLLRKSISFFLFLQVLRCFSSLRSLPYLMCSDTDDMSFLIPGFPIRKSMAHCLLAAPHGLSQLTTSFFGSKCQGILRVHFLA